jgi:hypothetical protein
LPFWSISWPSSKLTLHKQWSRTVISSKVGGSWFFFFFLFGRGGRLMADYGPATGVLISGEAGIFALISYFGKIKKILMKSPWCVCSSTLFFLCSPRLVKGMQVISSSQKFLFLSYLIHLLSNGSVAPFWRERAKLKEHAFLRPYPSTAVVCHTRSLDKYLVHIFLLVLRSKDISFVPHFVTSIAS